MRKPNKHCLGCGKAVYRMPSSKWNTIYCSECSKFKPWTKNLIPQNKGKQNGITKECLNCNAPFYVPQSQIRVKYCSQKCYHLHTPHCHSLGKHWKLSDKTKIKMSLHQLGQNNHNWKGGITDARKSRLNKVWCRQVKKRDSNMCCICKNRGEIAHHLYSYNKYPQSRFEISNGITLCNFCHETFHKIYGYGDNTFEQFKEWVENETRKSVENKERIGQNVQSLQY